MVLPRTVWAYWDSGRLPPFNQLCRDSWVRNLPGWTIRVVMGRRELRQLVPDAYLPRTFGSLTVHKRADSARIALLRAHGGVWMDASILLLGGYEWLEKLFNEDGKTFAGYAMHAFGKKDPKTGKRGDEAIENWWFATEPEGAVISEWNNAWVRWTTEDPKLSRVRQYQDTSWHTGDPRDNPQKQYLASEVALMYARTVAPASKKEFDEGRVWISNAQKDPFWLNGALGWHDPDFSKVSLQRMVEYEERELGHPIRFCKFTGGQRQYKEGAMDPDRHFPRGSAAHFIFSVHGHGRLDGGGTLAAKAAVCKGGALPASTEATVSSLSVGLMVMVGLLTLIAVVVDFVRMWRWHRSRSAEQPEAKYWSGSWHFPSLMPVAIFVNVAVIVLATTVGAGVEGLGLQVPAANRLGLSERDHMAFERVYRGRAGAWPELEDFVVSSAGSDDSVLVEGGMRALWLADRLGHRRVHAVAATVPEVAFLETKGVKAATGVPTREAATLVVGWSGVHAWSGLLGGAQRVVLTDEVGPGAEWSAVADLMVSNGFVKLAGAPAKVAAFVRQPNTAAISASENSSSSSLPGSIDEPEVAASLRLSAA